MTVRMVQLGQQLADRQLHPSVASATVAAGKHMTR